MSDISGVIGELCIEVAVTRAATGKVENFTLIGNAVAGPGDDSTNVKEQENGGNPLDSGS